MMTKLMVLAGFCIAFAAGVVAGIGGRGAIAPASSSAHPPATTGPGFRGGGGPEGYLAKQLNLTSEQQEQLKQIWSELAHRGRGEREDARRQFRKEREDAIAALIRPEDKEKYQQIQDAYTQKVDELDRQWRASFESAVERTKQILTAEQRSKYEEMLKHNQWDRGPRGDRGSGPGGPSSRPDDFGFGHARRVGDRATTRPGSDNR